MMIVNPNAPALRCDDDISVFAGRRQLVRNVLLGLAFVIGWPFAGSLADSVVPECSSDAGSRCPKLTDIVEVTGLQVAHNNGLAGGGYAGSDPWMIAIIDTGTSAEHDAFFDVTRFDGACFYGKIASCPGGTVRETGLGAGVPLLPDAYGFFHGTMVAGAAAGRGGVSSYENSLNVGAAPRADIHPVRIFGQDAPIPGDTPVFRRDLYLALDHLLDENDPRLAVVNISAGSLLGYWNFKENCDNEFPELFGVVGELRDEGILVVSSAGNAGYSGGVGMPACLSNVVSVSSSRSDGTVDARASFGGPVDIIAPGAMELPYVSDKENYLGSFGTSFASPILAGAAAALYDCAAMPTVNGGVRQTDTDDIVLQALLDGADTTSYGTGAGARQHKVLDVSGAMRLLTGDGVQDFSEIGGSSGSVRGQTMCADKNSYEPFLDPSNTIEGRMLASTMLNWTAPVSAKTTFSTCDGGADAADTYLAIFSGDADLSLPDPYDGYRHVASSDSGTGCEADDGGTAVSFDAQAGTRYRILVGPVTRDPLFYGRYLVDAVHGAYRLNWTQEVLDDRVTLVSPEQQADLRAEYVWNAWPGATYYRLWIDNASTGLDRSRAPVLDRWVKADDLQCADGGRCRFASTRSLGGSITWWVAPWSPTERTGRWSLPMEYETGFAENPATLQLMAPSGNVSGSRPVFRWRSPDPATWHQIYVRHEGGTVSRWVTASEAGCVGGGECQYQMPGTFTGASYWWVQPYLSSNGSDLYGEWSDALEFTIR